MEVGNDTFWCPNKWLESACAKSCMDGWVHGRLIPELADGENLQETKGNFLPINL